MTCPTCSADLFPRLHTDIYVCSGCRRHWGARMTDVRALLGPVGLGWAPPPWGWEHDAVAARTLGRTMDGELV